MAKIERVRLTMAVLAPTATRTDAIQSFVAQETPLLTVTDAEGAEGTGYAYTIGTGGPAVMALLRETLAPRLIGAEAEAIEGIWRDLLFATHATSVGAITSLALAAVDTALWDLRCRRAGQPLWRMAGGAWPSRPVYCTEGGWLHLSPGALAEDAAARKAEGFAGVKVKIGRPSLAEDRARLAAVRDAVGEGFEIMTDANQGFSLAEAIRRAEMLADLGVAWFEEPMPADDVGAHAALAARSRVPVAVGESLYSLSRFKDYAAQGAMHVCQVDAARVGGITPWLKTAHLAEAHNLPVAPHFLMELHASLACACMAGSWVEYIPQLDPIASSRLEIREGQAIPPEAPGLGIEWDWEAVAGHAAEGAACEIA